MSTAEDDVGALLKRLRAGDESVLGSLLDAYRPRLHREIAGELAADPRLAARFDASDVVQETMLDACRQIDRFVASRERVSFWVWLRGLARERRLKFLRDHLDAQCRTAKRQQALPEESGRHPSWPGASPSSAVQSAEEADRVVTAMQRLTVEDREIIRLRITEGRTNAEVATLLGATPAAVAKRLERALRRLREVASAKGTGP
jgi:RNA polymerase sigma-70 factor (ECF subfamily)